MKKAKSFLSILLCLLLTAALFASCMESDPGTSNDTGELSIEAEIVGAYYQQSSEAFRSQNPINSLSLRFRGVFNDTYVIFVDGPFVYFAAVTTESVGGITFRYPDSHKMTAYHQGSFYTLGEAYDLGLLTMNDLLQLKETYAELGAAWDKKGEVPTIRESCTHNTPPTESQPPEEFAYCVSNAQYLYRYIRETQSNIIAAIRSPEELAAFCGVDKSQLGGTHDDSFFEKNSLIVINYFVTKSPYNLLTRSVTESADGKILLEIDSYQIDPVSFLDKAGSLVLEVNRIVDDPQVKLSVIANTVSEAEYRELFPNDPVHPVFQPEGLRFDDISTLEERMNGSDNCYAKIAACLFTDPKDVNLYDMFRIAYPVYTDFTEVELETLQASFLSDAIGKQDIVKIPAGEMNSMLLKYLGLNIEQVDQVGMENLVYVSKTNSYYCLRGDAVVQPITVHSNYYHGGDFIYYELGEPDGYPDYVMQVEHEDGYFIVLSNQKLSSD